MNQAMPPTISKCISSLMNQPKVNDAIYGMMILILRRTCKNDCSAFVMKTTVVMARRMMTTMKTKNIINAMIALT